MDVYTAYTCLKNMQGYRYDSTTAKMVAVSGVRLAKTNTADIDPKILLELLKQLILKDRRWLHFRAELYDNLATNTEDLTKSDQYANLKQEDMTDYDSHFKPYEYNVLIP